MAKRVRAIAAARREAITWRRTYRADTPNAYWSYLQRYPRGPHAADARRRLSILTAPLEPPPTFDVIDYDVPPPPPEELIYVDRPVLAFGDPEFDFLPPPPAPVYYLPPPPDDFVILEPPPPPIGLFILPQPFFVPIPVYYQGATLCGAAAEQHHLRQHSQQGRHQQRHQPAAAAGSPVTGDAGLGGRGGGRPGSPVAPGAGCRHADAAACGRATGHADPAGQGAGAAERRDQSCRAGQFARRSGGAGRKAERAVAGQCAGRAAVEPDFAEDQRAAGSRRQGRAGRAAERCGIAPRCRQSEREARRAARRRVVPAGGPRSARSLRPVQPVSRELQRRHPAPRQGPPLRSHQDLSRNCGEPRRPPR